ncbi:helix-turn-helix domain-containing protein [Myxococcota bacterium]|nr:helix-turn-helix domain-containing protein [Myxococcota bacterium]
MAGDSYSLREASDLLGVSPRVLQRRIQEGAFPGRFLAPGRQGLETRLPTEEVDRAVEDLRRRSLIGAWRDGEHAERAEPKRDTMIAGRATVLPARELDSLKPYHAPELAAAPLPGSNPGVSSAVTHSDLESLRDAMLAIVREDREMFLTAVRDALMVRDRELMALRQELSGMRRTMESVREGLEGLGRRVADHRGHEQTIDAQLWSDLVEGSAAIVARGGVDVDALLRELSELESMLSASEPSDRR